MKKYKISINCLIIFIIIASIIVISIIFPLISDNLDAYSKVIIMQEFDNETQRDAMLDALRFNAMIKIISIIFSALSILACVIIFYLLNFKVWKQKQN